MVGAERPVDGEHFSREALATPPDGWSLEGSAPWAWLTQDLSDSGVIGDSRDSTNLLGEQIEKALVAHWLTLLKNLMGSEWPPVSAIEGGHGKAKD